jgi:hypothetical protein
MKVALGPTPMKLFELMSDACASAAPGAKIRGEAIACEALGKA